MAREVKCRNCGGKGTVGKEVYRWISKCTVCRGFGKVAVQTFGGKK